MANYRKQATQHIRTLVWHHRRFGSSSAGVARRPPPASPVAAMSGPAAEPPSAGAAGSAGAADEEESTTWTMWGGKCPMGSQCSKRGQTIKTCSSLEEAVEAVVHHLVTSPYHELQRAEAEAAIDYNLIESWEVDKKQWHADAAKWDAGKKRKAQLQWYPEDRVATPTPPTTPPPGSGPGTGRITLSEMQLRACVDSLKRAKVSAESAANLCAKASRAFNEEVTCIQQCVEVIESYVQPTRTLRLS